MQMMLGVSVFLAPKIVYSSNIKYKLKNKHPKSDIEFFENHSNNMKA